MVKSFNLGHWGSNLCLRKQEAAFLCLFQVPWAYRQDLSRPGGSPCLVAGRWGLVYCMKASPLECQAVRGQTVGELVWVCCWTLGQAPSAWGCVELVQLESSAAGAIARLWKSVFQALTWRTYLWVHKNFSQIFWNGLLTSLTFNDITFHTATPTLDN